jgi:hypothetical protein
VSIKEIFNTALDHEPGARRAYAWPGRDDGHRRSTSARGGVTGFPCYPLFAHDANLDPIRQDPHFKAFLEDMRKQSVSLQKTLFPNRSPQ